MLLSVLISLTAESSYPILGPLGRPAQAWFLQQLPPAMSGTLHDESGMKPYTVSTLLDEHGRSLEAGSWLKPGQHCFLRLTTLNEELSTALQKKVIQQLPKRLTFYKMDFRVDEVFERPAEHAWAGQTTFADMAQDVKVGNSVRMEFTSPTAFRSQGLDICLPIAGQVFRSWWERWNSYAPESMQVQEIWPKFAADCILVSELTAVNTTHWIFAEGTHGAATGFSGTVEFLLPRKSSLPKKWQEYYDGAAVVMQSLARFAFYCGTGHHTTVGMGQTRLVSRKT
jgi:CRISPR-associated endoribonuclease Cas6